MRLLTIIAGVLILAASFFASMKAMDWLSPADVKAPALVQLPPLPATSYNSSLTAPIAVTLSAIRDALDRAAPRNVSGKADNPVRQILSNADINWTVTRGPLAAVGAQNALSLSTPLDGKLTVLGSLSAAGGNALEGALGNALGQNVAKQIGNVSIKSLNANAAIHGNVVVVARPEILPNWRFDPKLTGQVNLGDTSVSIAGAKVAVPAQVKPLIDKTVNEQLAALQQRLRNDPTLETTLRREWARLCQSVELRAAISGLPPLWLEMRPVKAVAAQPRIDANAVTLMVGLQAETRVIGASTKPSCPFPATLDIVPYRNDGRVTIGVPIDLRFTDVSRIVESQLKGRTFPEDGSGSVDVIVKSATVTAADKRLLISLLINAKEKKSYFGFGGEATIHIWGRPVLDQQQQILRLADLELAVESDAAFGLLGAAARPAIPYLQRALAERANVDLKAFASDARQKLSAIIAGYRRNDAGMRTDASLDTVRLASIAFDSTTLRVVAEAEGAIKVTLTALPNL